MINNFLSLLPSITCRINTKEKKLFLTFDDGPVKEVTSTVLDILASGSARATFFCVGDNVQKNPELFRRIIKEGHTIGNHTFHHLNGWQNSKIDYLENINRCQETLESNLFFSPSSLLFRPPYGKLSYFQYAAIKKKYKIVMWDVLTRDWEKDRSSLSCFNRIKRNSVPGSIIVFHDSSKAQAKMLPALEMTIKHFSGLGFQFESLGAYL